MNQIFDRSAERDPDLDVVLVERLRSRVGRGDARPGDAMTDKEAIYDTEIAPLMARIIEACKANDLPFFASFQ